MKPDPEVKRYILRKKWVNRDDSVQYNIKTCPFCGSGDWKFYINKKTGQFRCFHGSCDEVGNSYTLKKKLGDLDHVDRIVQQRDEKVDPDKQTYYTKRLFIWFTLS